MKGKVTIIETVVRLIQLYKTTKVQYIILYNLCIKLI